MLVDRLLPVALDGALLFGCALAAMHLLRHATAATRRLVLALSLAGALALPFASALAPLWRIPAPVAIPALHGRLVEEPLVEARVTATTSNAELARVSISARKIDPASLLLVVWAIGALLVAARLAVGLVRASAIARRARPALGFANASARAERVLGVRAVVRETCELEGPAVTGVMSPVVLVPQASSSWSEERRYAVLLHELAHVQKRDCLANLAAELALALHWFDPLAWLCARRLRLERELAADDAVVSAGARASSYAEDLLAIAGACRESPHGAIGMGEPSRLVARVAAVLSPSRTRTQLRGSTSLVVFGVLSTVLAVACATQTETPTAPLVKAIASYPSTSAERSTLDSAVQSIAEQELDRALADWHAPAGAIVVLDPSTGQVRANAGRSHGAPDNVGEKTAYITGSTMKVVTLAAALDEGLASPSERIDCEHGNWNYQGKKITDAGSYGSLSMSEMLAVSSNIGFGKLFDRIGGDRLARELHEFHFGAAPGWMPDHIDDHSAAGLMVAIGESVTATPLQVAAAYAVIANGGAYVEPSNSVHSEAPRRQTIMKPETARAVMAMLDEAVNGELATGKLARIDGARVAGKTGTAGWDLPGGGEGRYASFVGIVPSAAPRYVILVGVEQPKDNASGGQVAAPVFARVASRALAVH